jgi:nitrile hydratase subunit beta
MARGHHDIGGLPGGGPIDQSEHSLSDWEILADAVNQALGARGVKRTDEMRRAREEMDSAAYRHMTYYERWIASIEAILIEKKILNKEEIDRKLAEFEAKWGEP